MDPVTQGLLGATAAQSASSFSKARVATVLGALSGMAPDLDVLIKSNTDPLLALEFHRQFTHSLFFIPVGALLCAIVAHIVWTRRCFDFKASYGFCFLGYATHALLDACTTYGTLLLWPFTSQRIAWNTISVVDPLFTLPVLALVLIAFFKRSSRAAIFALCYMLAYLALGLVQNNRALEAAQQIAQERGHIPLRHDVKPSFGNIVLWKSIYEYQGRYYVDAVRVAITESYRGGASVRKLDKKNDFSWLQKGSQQDKDLERFRWFSNDFLALDSNNPNLVIDMRYSLLPDDVDSFWGVELNPVASSKQHIRYITNRPQGGETRDSFQALWDMIVRPLSESLN